MHEEYKTGYIFANLLIHIWLQLKNFQTMDFNMFYAESRSNKKMYKLKNYQYKRRMYSFMQHMDVHT